MCAFIGHSYIIVRGCLAIYEATSSVNQVGAWGKLRAPGLDHLTLKLNLGLIFECTCHNFIGYILSHELAELRVSI